MLANHNLNFLNSRFPCFNDQLLIVFIFDNTSGNREKQAHRPSLNTFMTIRDKNMANNTQERDSKVALLLQVFNICDPNFVFRMFMSCFAVKYVCDPMS